MAKNPSKKLSWLLIINEYIINGGKQAKAYSHVFKEAKDPDSASSRLFNNAKFIKILDKRLAEIKAKSDIEVGELELMYREGFEIARKERQPSAMQQNTTGIARLYGKDKDSTTRDPVQIVILPPSLPAATEASQDVSKAMTKPVECEVINHD